MKYRNKYETHFFVFSSTTENGDLSLKCKECFSCTPCIGWLSNGQQTTQNEHAYGGNLGTLESLGIVVVLAFFLAIDLSQGRYVTGVFTWM